MALRRMVDGSSPRRPIKGVPAGPISWYSRDRQGLLQYGPTV
jgi:hypothetical protein